MSFSLITDCYKKYGNLLGFLFSFICLFICLSVYFVKSLFYFHRCLLTIQILSILYIFYLFYHFFSIIFCIKIYTISSYSSHLYHFLPLFYNKINLSLMYSFSSQVLLGTNNLLSSTDTAKPLTLQPVGHKMGPGRAI